MIRQFENKIEEIALGEMNGNLVFSLNLSNSGLLVQAIIFCFNE